MKTVMLSLLLILSSAQARADQCQLADGRSVTIDDAGNVTAPAELAGWRLSDKDDASGLEIYKRGSSPRETLDVSSCSSGQAELKAGIPSLMAALLGRAPARELGTCYCECDQPDGQILETGKEFEGEGQYQECEAACQAQFPGSKSVCAR